MPCTITAFLPMTFVCKWHTDCEIEVFQPANTSAYVGKCIKCQQEQDAKENIMQAEQQNEIKELKFDNENLVEVNQKLVEAIREKQKKIADLSAKPKRKPSLYLDGRKINFVTKKKGGKK
jgi:hypothetical protein